MLGQTEKACFLIADISGYTSFLAGVELDHAHDIIADVMDTVIRRLRPPFRLAKLEGDAAFLYAVADKVDGSVLQDTIEGAYFAYRRRLRSIKLASACTCAACSRMQDLDLKFVAHHGEFIKHRMAGREEIAGRDVIVIHRLLKNEVSERLGGHAYALYSDACIEAMGIDPSAQGLTGHSETIDIIGLVPCRVRDLEEAWAQENARRRNEVTRDKAFVTIEFDIAAPRSHRLGSLHPADAAAPVARRRIRFRRARKAAGAASAPPTTACTARTPSSRRCRTGAPSTISP